MNTKLEIGNLYYMNKLLRIYDEHSTLALKEERPSDNRRLILLMKVEIGDSPHCRPDCISYTYTCLYENKIIRTFLVRTSYSMENFEFKWFFPMPPSQTNEI